MVNRRRTAIGLLALTSVLFFASGSTGLAYEVIWSKRFTHIWGSSTLAMASVVASFLFGLGLGALVFGRFADRVARPLFWYGVAEILIGLVATVIPLEIVWLANWANEIYATLPAVESLRFLFRCAMTLVVIGPPCVLMGGTLPLLIRQFTPRDSDAGYVTGWLYAINTFGAATGCAVAGFYLLPAIGLQITNYLTAIANVLIGVTSIVLSTLLASKLAELNAPESKEKQPAKPAAAKPRGAVIPATGQIWSVYVAVALTGLAALILQMVWVRQLALVLGGSTYAFTATLFIILVAIALGSLIYQLGLRPFANSPYLTLTVIALVSVSTVAGLLLLPWLSDFVGGYAVTRYQWSVNAGISILAGAIVQFLPGIAMGILFPLLVDLTHARAAVVGRTVGNIYAWNTLGSIAGATFTSFYLIPLLGTIGTIALALAFYLVAGGLMLWSLGTRSRSIPLVAAYGLAGAALVVFTIFHSRAADPRLTNYGAYMYGPLPTIEGFETLLFREGPSCNVLVSEMSKAQNLSRVLRVNGKVDASTGLDMENQLGTAYFPRFFTPRAKEVLVIGFGSGTTPGAAAMFPNTHVTCVEIEPATYEASKYFEAVNHSPEKSDRVTLLLGDGRTFVQTSPKKYDLIISEPSNPWIAGVSNLFTREYFQSALAHLNEGGVMVQWIQTYNFTLPDYTLVARTLRSVFPHVGVVTLSGGADTVLMASTRPLLPSSEDLDFMQLQIDVVPAIVKDLNKWFGTSDVRRLLLSHYFLDERGLDVLIARDGSSMLNTDLNMKLEFDAPLRLFARKTPDVYPAVREVSTSQWIGDLATRLGYPPTTVEHFMALAWVADRRKDPFRAIEMYRTALSLNPNYEPALRELSVLYAREKKPKEAEETLRKLIELQPQEAALHASLADVLVAEKRTIDAVSKYREALKIDPKLAGAANNLAWILATHPEDKFRDGREAIRLAKIACDATGNREPGYLDTLAAAYAEAGQFDQAVATIGAAQKRATVVQNPLFTAGLQMRMDAYRQRRPYRDK